MTVIKPKRNRFHIVNGERLVYTSSGRENMMVWDGAFGSNYGIYWKNDVFIECGRDVPYSFLMKYLINKPLKISKN